MQFHRHTYPRVPMWKNLQRRVKERVLQSWRLRQCQWFKLEELRKKKEERKRKPIKARG